MRCHGGPEVVEYSETTTPKLNAGQVMIRLKAVALNHLDIWVRKGWPGLNLKFPHIMGSDGAGVIETMAPDVRGFKTGDRTAIYPVVSCKICPQCQQGHENLCRRWQLIGETINGTFAEFLVIPAENLLILPSHISYRQAAAATLTFTTAWHSMVTKGRLKRGETVLVVGASGGVNTASIQIAKYLGAKVIVLGSSQKKLALAESLGADILLNRQEHRLWSKAVYLASGRQGADMVIDNVGEKTISESIRAAAKGARILTVGNTSGPILKIDNRFIFSKHLSIIGSTLGSFNDFKEVMKLIFAAKLQPVLDQDYPINEAKEALKHLESGRQLGKLTLRIEPNI